MCGVDADWDVAEVRGVLAGFESLPLLVPNAPRLSLSPLVIGVYCTYDLWAIITRRWAFCGGGFAATAPLLVPARVRVLMGAIWM